MYMYISLIIEILLPLFWKMLYVNLIKDEKSKSFCFYFIFPIPFPMLFLYLDLSSWPHYISLLRNSFNIFCKTWLLAMDFINFYLFQFSSVQLLSRVRLFATPWMAARQASLSITIPRSSLRLTRVGDAIQPSHPLSSPSPPALNLSQHQGLF